MVCVDDAGLSDVGSWRSARRGDAKRWAFLWGCLHAFLLHLPATDRLTALQQAAGSEDEGLELVVEVLRAGVEVGGRAGGPRGAHQEEEEAPVVGDGPSLTSFLAASHPLTTSTGGANKDEPSPRAFTLLLPSATASQAATLVLLVERGLRTMVMGGQQQQQGGGRADDWRGGAYLLLLLLNRLEAALRLTGRGAVNEEALTPVLMPRAKAGMFGGVEEVAKGMEVWWLDKKDGAWRKGSVVGVHTDDEEKYFTIAKAGGGETQTELAR